MSKAIQEIVADLRRADMSGAHVDAGHIADQIELAFAELEDKWLHTPGNAAAMREALGPWIAFAEWLLENAGKDGLGRAIQENGPTIRQRLEELRAALSAPARNCDLRYYNNATIDVCSARAFVDHLRYCEKYGACCKCPMNSENGNCLAKYLLSPAEGGAS